MSDTCWRLRLVRSSASGFAAVVLSALVVAAPSAQTNPNLKALLDCLSNEKGGGGFLEYMDPDPNSNRMGPQSRVSLMCQGQLAEALFRALEFSAAQEIKQLIGSDKYYVTRQGGGISCARFSATSHLCTVNIEATNQIVDSMR